MRIGNFLTDVISLSRDNRSKRVKNLDWYTNDKEIKVLASPPGRYASDAMLLFLDLRPDIPGCFEDRVGRGLHH